MDFTRPFVILVYRQPTEGVKEFPKFRPKIAGEASPRRESSVALMCLLLRLIRRQFIVRRHGGGGEEEQLVLNKTFISRCGRRRPNSFAFLVVSLLYEGNEDDEELRC